MTITNNTKKVHFSVPTAYTKSTKAHRSSAEWIVEAPYLNGVLPLAHFGTVAFSQCLTTINGTKASISNNKWMSDALNMVTPNGVTKAAVSGLSSDGKGFTVTWKHE